MRKAKTPMVYMLTDCELDPSCFELRRAGKPIHIEPQMLELLIYSSRTANASSHAAAGGLK